MTEHMIDLVRERRRFTAMMIVHPRLQKHADLRKVLGEKLWESEPLALAAGWDLHRAEILDTRNRYPDTAATSDTRLRGDGSYGHDCYAAFPKSKTVEHGRPLILAAPYVGLLRRTVRLIEERLGAPTLSYLGPRMDALFEALQESPPTIEATKITLKLSGQPGVDFVTLAGRSPLISKLRRLLDSSGASLSLGTKYKSLPYSTTVGFDYFDPGMERYRSLRFHLDRHGNFWWYQHREDVVRVAFSAFDYLIENGLNELHSKLPLDRLEDDEDDG